LSEVFTSGAWRQIRRGEVCIGGQWRRLTRAEAYFGSDWHTVASFVPPLSVSVTPFVTGFANPFKPTTLTITTEPATATPSGGQAPYSYLWSGGNTPTNATNTFTRTIPPDTNQNFVYSVTVTDSQGKTAFGSVTAQFINQSTTG